MCILSSKYERIVNAKETTKYRLANCTKPHPFPTGIFTETISPYCKKGCLRSSSLTFGSSPPTKIYTYQTLAKRKHGKVFKKSKNKRKAKLKDQISTVVFGDSPSD